MDHVFNLHAADAAFAGAVDAAVLMKEQAKKAGIKPIVGCEFYIAPDKRSDKKQIDGQHAYHIVLLAMDHTGYKNLMKLAAISQFEGFYYKPRVDKVILSQYSKGLVASSACLKGEISSSLLSGDTNQAYRLADDYLNIFGRGNFYLEIMENGMPEQKKVNTGLIKMSKDLDIPLVATNDIHYLEKNEAFAHEALLSIQTQTLRIPTEFWLIL